MYAQVLLSGSAPRPGPLTLPLTQAADPASATPVVVVVAVAVALLLLLFAAAVWFLRPALRVRHARLDGATPEQAMLAGRGRSAPHAQAQPVLTGTIITVLPASRPVEARPPTLAEDDLELVCLLGADHPMSAPGRHRTAGAALTRAGGEGTELDAETLLRAPVSAVEPAGADELDELDDELDELDDELDKLDDELDGAASDAPRDDPDEHQPGEDRPEPPPATEPISARSGSPASESGDMTGFSDARRASAFYDIDWHDEEWLGIELVDRPEAANAAAEWWTPADARATRQTAPDDTPPREPDLPHGPFQVLSSAGRGWDDLVHVGAPSAPLPPGGSIGLAPDDEPDPEPMVGQYLVEPGEQMGLEAIPDPVGTVPPLLSVPVPGQRPSGRLSAAQHDALRIANGRLDAAEDRIAVARIVTEEASVLADADSVALVVNSPDGPRVLSVSPGTATLWGPQTLVALISVGAPVREVVDGDPLADGATTALLAVPMASAGARVGTLLARRDTPRPFTAVEESLLDRMARMAGAALDGLTRRGVLRREEGVDPVTSLAPQNRLAQDLQAALRSSSEHGMPVSLVVAEVDGLARMRTELGVQEADEVLALIARTFSAGLRVGDLPYRFDEDVLAVLLAATEAEDAAQVAARLVDEVDAATDGAYDLARPLRLRTVVIDVVGTAQDILDEAQQALAEQRVQVRWAR